MSSAFSLVLTLMASVLAGLAVGSGVLAIISLYQGRKGQQALATAIEPYADDIPQTVPRTLADRIVAQLEKREWGKSLLNLLEQAEIGIAPGRLILVAVVWAGVGLFAGIFLLHNLLFGLLLAAALIGVGFFLVGRQAQRRWQRLAEQFPEALTIVSNALIAGSGVLQAFERAARELSPPISPELERVVQDVRVGLDLEEALQSLQQRVPVA
ncbi:MAG: type II secretion system F family protein, partial [Ardenticatenia bacterium]|nr:type II secretion system F family protein [Ardenticatenia bacterium]